MSKQQMPVLLNTFSIRFSKVPYSLDKSYASLKLKIFNETGTIYVKILS